MIKFLSANSYQRKSWEKALAPKNSAGYSSKAQKLKNRSWHHTPASNWTQKITKRQGKKYCSAIEHDSTLLLPKNKCSKDSVAFNPRCSHSNIQQMPVGNAKIETSYEHDQHTNTNSPYTIKSTQSIITQYHWLKKHHWLTTSNIKTIAVS